MPPRLFGGGQGRRDRELRPRAVEELLWGADDGGEDEVRRHPDEACRGVCECVEEEGVVDEEDEDV